MKLCIPLEGRVRTIIRSSFVVARRTAETRYALMGDSFQMSEITPDQVIILPDGVNVTEGMPLLTHVMASFKKDGWPNYTPELTYTILILSSSQLYQNML